MIASPSLTDRQRQVLYVYALTGSYKATAHELGIGYPTVKHHIAEVIHRLGVESAVQAVLVVFGRVA